MIRIVFAFFCSLYMQSGSFNEPKEDKIILRLVVHEQHQHQKIALKWGNSEALGRVPEWKDCFPVSKGDTLTWRIDAKSPVTFKSISILDTAFNTLLEPGDSVLIELKRGSLCFSGRGENKMKLLQELQAGIKKFRKPSLLLMKNPTLEDFKKWEVYIDSCKKTAGQILVKYQNSVSPYAYSYCKTDVLSGLEMYLVIKFMTLFNYGKLQSPEVFNQLYDSVINKEEIQWMKEEQTGKNLSYLYNLAYLSALRDYNFIVPDSLKEKQLSFRANLFKVIFDKVSRIYSGRMKDLLQLHMMTAEGSSMNPVFEKMKAAYKASIQSGDIKSYLQAFEQAEAQKNLKKNVLPYFSLPDRHNRYFTVMDGKDKIMILNIWQPKNQSSKNIFKILKPIADKFGTDTNFLFVSIAVNSERSEWLEAIEKDDFNLNGGNHLIAEKEDEERILQGFDVGTETAIFLVNPENKLVNGSGYKILVDSGTELKNQLVQLLAEGDDGPYVICRQKDIAAWTIKDGKVYLDKFGIHEHKVLKSGTDRKDVFFKYEIARNHLIEPSEFSMPSKMMILSDIEGNFEAFRKLLQANKIINKDFNWIFGKGHLVFAGDMFDRGMQVTECLWLIYALEKKARKAGGYVHFILGNHEIMNLSNDTRYVQHKYKLNAKRIGLTYAELYNENSELGRWLRTKNVIEKIGGLLFAHGGISPEMNRLKLSVAEINNLARPNYTGKTDDYKDIKTNTIMNSSYGPFWYRGYYKSKDKVYKASQQSVDSILQQYSVKHIITGHSIVADTISTHYDNKVINTDIEHAKGKSEALLIEGANFYRVNAEGKRVLLFRDEEKYK